MKLSKFSGFLPIVIFLLTWNAVANAQDMVKLGPEPIDNSIDPSKLAYDYLVDGNLPQDDPANKQFKTLQAAYAAAPAGTRGRPTVIGIKPIVYQIRGSLERVPSMRVTKNWMTFLGLTNNRRVVLADNRGLQEGASDDGYLLDVNATGFTAKNLTVLNYCNCDYEYPGDPSKNLKMRNPTITQAVALQATGDMHVYENVALLSRLDTMFLRTTRSYFKTVYIEGTDDWMGGGQLSVWQDCRLVYPTGRGVMSAANVVFFICTFEATRGMQFYKAEYGGAAMPNTLINCTLPVASPQAPVAWVRGAAAARPSVYSLTYHNKDAAGNPAVIYDDSVSGPAFTYSRELSEADIAAFNPWNLLRGTDDWDPAGVKDKYEAAGQGHMVYRMSLNSGGATGRGRVGAGEGGGLGASTAAASTIRTGGPGLTLGANTLPSQGADKTITWTTQSDLVNLSRSTGSEIVVTGKNSTDQAQYVSITAQASDGFYVTSWVYVEPKFIDPPTIQGIAKLNPPAGGKVSVDYTLDLGRKEDQSNITWFACDDAAGAHPVKVAVSRGNQPFRQYTLMPADAGKFLRVSIEPKHQVSEAGPAVYATSAAAIGASDIPSSTVTANFRNFVETATDGPIAGRWTVLGAWAVVPGANLTNGYGLRSAAGSGGGGRGPAGPASFFYFKEGDATDMQVDLVMRPDKTEGTVFAVPGGPRKTIAAAPTAIFSSNTIRKLAMAIPCATGEPSNPPPRAHISSTKLKTASARLSMTNKSNQACSNKTLFSRSNLSVPPSPPPRTIPSINRR